MKEIYLVLQEIAMHFPPDFTVCVRLGEENGAIVFEIRGYLKDEEPYERTFTKLVKADRLLKGVVNEANLITTIITEAKKTFKLE